MSTGATSTSPAATAAGAQAQLRGVGVSAGVVVGPVARLVAPVSAPSPHPAPLDPEAEADRIAPAMAAVAADLRARAARTTPETAAILEATALMASDPTLGEQTRAFVVTHRVPATRAVWVVAEGYAATLEALGGYLGGRARDVRDVRDRVIARLEDRDPPGIPDPGHPFVLVARDLAPADTALLDPDTVLALVTEEGGPTGHTAIIARSIGLPGVVACPGAGGIPDGVLVLVDGTSGVVTVGVEPGHHPLLPFASREVVRLPPGPHGTRDGTHVRLLANVGDGAGARSAVESGVTGTGLFRTELLFLDRTTEPSLEEQQHAYAEVFAAFGSGPIVVRTLDAGADKPLPFLAFPGEINPALGVRGLRVGLDRPDVLDRQLTAIARAAADTETAPSVMAPMVATVEEAAWFRERCRAAGLGTVGVMVEVPAAALLARELLEVVDFLSVGTNDLTQYAMAADRVAGRLALLNDPWQPAVLRLVALVGEAGRAAGKPVGVCGEAAADPTLAVVLVGLGVTSLSADKRALPAVAAALRTVTSRGCAAAAAAARAAATAEAARHAARAMIATDVA